MSNTSIPLMPHGATRSNGDHSSNAVIPPIPTFKPRIYPTFGGIRLPTILIFAAQIILLAGTALAWFFTSKHLNTLTVNGKNLFKGQPSIIFVHAMFAVLVLLQVVFLERRIFRIRVERYAYRHPGETLLRARHQSIFSARITFVPWTRASPAAYAAELFHRGTIVTRDVEDRFTNPTLWQHRGHYPPSRQVFTEQSRSPKPRGKTSEIRK